MHNFNYCQWRILGLWMAAEYSKRMLLNVNTHDYSSC